MSAVAVVTVDGPAAAGKGTVAQQVASALAFHYLDSGKLYRAAAFTVHQRNIAVGDSDKITALLKGMTADQLTPHLQNPALISPPIGQLASALAANARLRQLLLPLQRAMRQPPGLVADGRDMGTVVFPDATLCVFLTADLSARAQRRHKQLKERGIYATMRDVCAEIEQRDQQDESRATAPLKPPVGALIIDSTHQSIGDIVQTILRVYHDAASTTSTTE